MKRKTAANNPYAIPSKSNMPTVRTEESRRKAVMSGAKVAGKLSPAMASKIRTKANKMMGS